MVRPIGGTGPVLPPQDQSTRIAANFKADILKYVEACSTLNPDHLLAEFASKTVALAKIAQEAQSC